jgi:hypothetical protein
LPHQPRDSDELPNEIRRGQEIFSTAR